MTIMLASVASGAHHRGARDLQGRPIRLGLTTDVRSQMLEWVQTYSTYSVQRSTTGTADSTVRQHPAMLAPSKKHAACLYFVDVCTVKGLLWCIQYIRYTRGKNDRTTTSHSPDSTPHVSKKGLSLHTRTHTDLALHSSTDLRSMSARHVHDHERHGDAESNHNCQLHSPQTTPDHRGP